MCLLFYRHLFQYDDGEPLPKYDWRSDDEQSEDDQEQVGNRRKVKRKKVLPLFCLLNSFQFTPFNFI